MAVAKFQIGKNGLTEGIIQSLALHLKNHKQIRISVLKSAVRDKSAVEKMANEITSRLQKTSTRVIGFTIVLKKR